MEEVPSPISKLLFEEAEPRMTALREYIARQSWSTEYEVVPSNPYLLEVTARGANKGLSVLWVARHLGVRPEDIYCVGNGLNDIPMLAVSALSFAPANSYPEVRAAADVVLPSCDESCVARLIEHLEVRYDNR